MAIYRDGTASLSADGKATGTGTQWTKPLSLIRVGATVIFLSGSKPVLGTISEIVSDTQMNLTSTNGETAADGQYAILVHDSLTVEGLAQDISEALRYYQGAEAEIAQLNQQIQSYVKSAQDSATAAKTSETNAGTKATAAANSANAAASSATAAKTSETNAGNSASAAAGSANTASQRATAAAGSATTAGDRATAAANSAAAAKTSETNAANTLAGAVKKSGDTMTGALFLPGLEISASTPFIDFHYGNGVSDYNLRMINSDEKTLTIIGENGSGAILNVVGSVTTSTGVTATGGGINTRGAAPATAPAAGTETASGVLEAGFSSGVYLGVRSLFHTAVVQGAGTSAIIAIQTSASGAYTRFQFSQGGNAIAPANWVSNSDRRLKKNIEPISEPLEKMRQISGVTWDRVDGVGPGIGFIAQDVQAVFPKNVFTSGNRALEDGSVVEDVLSPDTAGVAAALHHEAILALMDKVEALEKRDQEKNAIISELQKRMKAIDGLDA